MKRNGTIIDFQSKKKEPTKNAPESERALCEADFFIWAKLLHNDLQTHTSQIKNMLLQWNQNKLEKNGNQERILSLLAVIESHVDLMEEPVVLESLRLDKELIHMRKKYNQRMEVAGK